MMSTWRRWPHTTPGVVVTDLANLAEEEALLAFVEITTR